MGTEVDPSDMDHVVALADQVVELSAYRTRLADYLRARMQALAPNLTTLVGELVGARLVQHAGSIMNLAKQPASTVQILGAEKALFRALKTKHDTPKYGRGQCRNPNCRGASATAESRPPRHRRDVSTQHQTHWLICAQVSSTTRRSSARPRRRTRARLPAFWPRNVR